MTNAMEQFKASVEPIREELHKLGDQLAATYDRNKAPEGKADIHHIIWMAVMHALPSSVSQLRYLMTLEDNSPAELQRYIFRRADTIKEIREATESFNVHDPNIKRALELIEQTRTLAATALDELGGQDIALQASMEVGSLLHFNDSYEAMVDALGYSDTNYEAHVDETRPFLKWAGDTYRFNASLHDDKTPVTQLRDFLLERKAILLELIDTSPFTLEQRTTAFIPMTAQIDKAIAVCDKYLPKRLPLTERMARLMEEVKPILQKLDPVIENAGAVYDELPEADKAKLQRDQVVQFFGHAAKDIVVLLKQADPQKSDTQNLEYFVDCFKIARDKTAKNRAFYFKGTALDDDRYTDIFTEVSNDIIALALRHLREIEKGSAGQISK